jgi:hypothetical protein
MRGVKPGAAKYLRVVESPEKRYWTRPVWGGQGIHAPGMNWHSFENKRILGTVPVEEDGSAYFEVPAERFVYFQLLDKDGMMIQSMRSGTIVQPGELQGCIGCHDSRTAAPSAARGRVPKAFRREPSRMNGWHGPARRFSYQAEVQPVFDKHCAGCHDFGKPAGKKLVLAGDRAPAFNASYTDLWSNGFVSCIGAGPAPIQQAYAWGSHRSRLVQTIRKGHNDVKLSKEELDRVVTWVDINAPYYPTYACAYPANPIGRCPLTSAELGRLQKLARFRAVRNHRGRQRAWISFDRPERSPCLARIPNKESSQYKEALAIIRKGAERLKARPRADMPGFTPCAADRKRDAAYARRRAEELRNREAIREGRKAYDPKPEPVSRALHRGSPRHAPQRLRRR